MVEAGREAPELTLEDRSGDVSLADFRGATPRARAEHARALAGIS